jgi:hypothetical protein
MTPAQFDAQLRGNGRVIYHTGLLMRDRQRESNPHSDVWRAVDDLAKHVWSKYGAGRVSLTQIRITPGVCQYIATRV